MIQSEVTYIRHRLPELRVEEPVLELGAGWDLEFHRRPFREAGFTEFFSHDVRDYEATTQDFLGDICQRTDIPESFAGCCLLFNVLEHVYAPWVAVDEVWRILKPQGALIGSVPLRTAIHRHDKDYWRFCPDGIAYLLRRFRLVHFAIDGNVGLPANLLFTGLKEVGDWSEENQEAVLRPEVILGNDYVTGSRWKRQALDQLRRRLNISLEIWDGPWNTRRMRELGFADWTVVDYSERRR
jgi:SAM-dependent methyltransferase